MANYMRYFIGNWKMFGVPKSISILDKINKFVKSDKKFNKKYKVVITPPHTLVQSYAKFFLNKKILIGAQNCFYKDNFGANTGAISPLMIKSIGAQYIIVGHSDNRSEGDTDVMLKAKVESSLNNKLKVVFCIGENKEHKIKNKTFEVLENQIQSTLNEKLNLKNIIVAYEPIWSIGTGQIPEPDDLLKTTIFIKKVLKKIFKKQKSPIVLYGGSVDSKNISQFKKLNEIDGFLIGGASKSDQNFIDIIKNYYR
ncbi:MAG: triosephosphate isomerase [Pelagibacteraceae bacterium]|jgi:triosephosphate isomerase (TIM)|nr:triosephosphate isomerase [Pelagibacteraceae bacterium]